MSVKEEYESLNGKVRQGTDKVFQTVTIDDSVIDEVDIRKALDIYHNSADSIIYFGAPWCPWCRNALPVLITYAKRKGQRITYVDLDHKRPIYTKDADGFHLVSQGDKDYPLLITAFKSIMDNCVAKTPSGLVKVPNSYNIDLPLTVFGSFGKIVGHHYGTVALKADQSAYDLLTDAQTAELLAIFEKKGSLQKGAVCTLDGECH